MRISICQSNYIPWRGYYDLIATADVFIFHDDIQYTKQDWRNRNRIKMEGGTQWLTVPVKKAPTDTPIDRIEIDNSNPSRTGCPEWVWRHRQAIESSLSRAPYWVDAFALHSHVNGDSKGYRWRSLAAMNQAMTCAICDYLGIKTRIVDARGLGCIGKKTEKILALIHAVGGGRGDTYISGPAARQYLDVELLAAGGIATEWKSYEYAPYPQQHGAYDGYVTVLDLIANLGPAARQFITSLPEPEAMGVAA